MPLVRAAWERKRDDPAVEPRHKRLLAMTVANDSIPSEYFQYYLFKDEMLAELQGKPTTRAQDIMASVPDYWTHYREQAETDCPGLDPGRSRGGINELELAIDVMDAIFNDRKEIWPVNVPNHGSVADLPDQTVVETVGYVDASGIRPLAMGDLPPSTRGLVKMLTEYQLLAADAAWNGTRKDAVRALASNPLCFSLPVAETIYDELAAAHRDYLPERLLS
jgi:6-phospho-beta-glucosidase